MTLYRASVRERLSATSVSLAVVLIAWFVLGLFDFWSGFVEFSLPRLVLLVILALALLPFELPHWLHRLFFVWREKRALGFLVLLVLSVMGYVLFLTRYLRGANMADDAIFQTVIQNTAKGCFFCFSAPGGTYFGDHNNLFLVAFVPFTVFANWWLIVHFVQSVVIVLWCRVCGWALGGDSEIGWLATIALFLATYTQHASFYDARFAALGLSIFAVGFYLLKPRLVWLGSVAALVSRETTGLALFMFGLVGIVRKQKRIVFAVIALLGLSWWIGSYLLMSVSGRPPALGRFNPCLNPTVTFIPTPTCIATSIADDWKLKLAYTLRLLRFAPSLGIVPSVIAALPDFGLTWLSRDDVLYSLGWHYYMQTLGLFIVGAGLSIRKGTRLGYSNALAIRWIVATCLWQFVTTVRPNLF